MSIVPCLCTCQDSVLYEPDVDLLHLHKRCALGESSMLVAVLSAKTMCISCLSYLLCNCEVT